MYSDIAFRNGDEENLALKFLEEYILEKERIKKSALDNISYLDEKSIIAVHFADAGAQGDSGCVEILYFSDRTIRILYGNYAYGNLDLNKVFEKLPMLRSLDTRSGNVPYPFGGCVDIPKGWGYMYMGVMNHLFCRDFVADRTRTFVETIIEQKTCNWALFDAIAWFCGCNI